MFSISAISAETTDNKNSAIEAREKKKYQKSELTSDESEMKADRRRLNLSPGEDKIVDLQFKPSVESIKIGNPELITYTIINVKGVPKQIHFTPAKEGTTTVTMRDSEGTVRLIFDVIITKSNIKRLEIELSEILKGVEGLQIGIKGDKIVLDGDLLVPADYGRVFAVAVDKSYIDYVINLTKISPISMKVITDKIQTDIKGFAPNVSARLVNNQIWLEGSVNSLSLARQAERVAKLYLPEFQPAPQIVADESVSSVGPRALVQNFILVEPPPPKKQDKLVRVTLHFVELSKNYNKIFAFNWRPGFTSDPRIGINVGTATGSDVTGGTSFTATISSLFPKLESAKTAGFARVLRTANLIVRSGQPARLDDQRTIPFALVAANNQATTSSAKVGLAMSVTPAILGDSQDIQLDINVSQTNLLGKNEQGAPETANHTVETKLYVQSSESAAIAGLQASDITTSFNKDDPNSGEFQGAQTSPLFNLKRSKSYSKDRAQYVVFVTPQIVNNASDGTKDLRKNFRVKVN